MDLIYLQMLGHLSIIHIIIWITHEFHVILMQCLDPISPTRPFGCVNGAMFWWKMHWLLHLTQDLNIFSRVVLIVLVCLVKCVGSYMRYQILIWQLGDLCVVWLSDCYEESWVECYNLYIRQQDLNLFWTTC